MDPLELDPDVLATLRALAEHRVEHVVIGDVADAILDGGGFVDTVTIVPGAYARNLERLAAALAGLDAELRVPGERQAQPAAVSPARLRELGRCTLVTRHADVEVDFQPAGTAGYADLFTDSRAVALAAGVTPQVACADDLDRIAEAAARQPLAPPDRAARPPAGAPTRASARRASPSAGPARARGRDRAQPR